MDLKFIKANKDGDQNSEWVMFRAEKDCDISQFQVADRTYDDDGTTSNRLRHVYRFPSLAVKQGEFAFLKTGKGKYSKLNSNGLVMHYFFWGLGKPVWNDDQADAVILQRIAETEYHRV